MELIIKCAFSAIFFAYIVAESAFLLETRTRIKKWFVYKNDSLLDARNPKKRTNRTKRLLIRKLHTFIQCFGCMGCWFSLLWFARHISWFSRDILAPTAVAGIVCTIHKLSTAEITKLKSSKNEA